MFSTDENKDIIHVRCIHRVFKFDPEFSLFLTELRLGWYMLVYYIRTSFCS